MSRVRMAARRGSDARGLPWLLLTVAAVVLGLLGMHTLHNADPAGHVAALSATPHSLPHTLSIDVDTGPIGLPGTVAAHTAASPAGDGHEDLSIACMLALLLTFAALIRATRGTALRRAVRPHIRPHATVILRTLARRPSLSVLSISRT